MNVELLTWKVDWPPRKVESQQEKVEGSCRKVELVKILAVCRKKVELLPLKVEQIRRKVEPQQEKVEVSRRKVEPGKDISSLP